MARDCFKNTISDYSGNISRNILYNASLSNDPTILEDATLADDFSHFKSVRVNRLKSVLAIPLVYKGTKKGILYIDNNEIPGIFNEDIVELAKHFAISVCAVLENLERVNTIAQLSSDVEQINQKFIDSSELFTLGKIHPLTMHDLKSYLSYILFGIDDLQEELQKRYSGNDEFLTEIIGRLKNSVSVINKHINSNNALVSRGKTLEFENLSSEFILDDIKEFVEPFSEKDKINLQFIDGLESPVSFSGNKYLLNNVFINIIINALDSLRIPMEKDKNICIEMGRTEYTIKFRFSNNGPKISDDIKDRIFSPFVSSKKKEASNSGLGLYISEKIIEYHKGVIYLDEYSDMTSFVIELTIDG
jgi:signal transduction histidine kinase